MSKSNKVAIDLFREALEDRADVNTVHALQKFVQALEADMEKFETDAKLVQLHIDFFRMVYLRIFNGKY